MPPRRILRLGLFDNILRVPIRPDALGQQSSSFAVKNHRKLHRRAETRPPAHPKHSSTQLRLYRHSPQARSAVETPDMGKKEDKAKAQSLKTPKGTRDWVGSDMVLRDRIFSTITEVFKRHGATALDTPVFELKDILTGKYGEDSKLIYDLADQGGEICSLRYDLTVPLARFLAMDTSIQTFKRYQIAKVYRRDNPAILKGRMREFYQCDLDIAGIYDPMIPDAEILCIIVEVFRALQWKDFVVKINHRKVLDGMFLTAGVPAEKIRAISSAVDKLDKSPWDVVRKEMVEEKGLAEDVADRIGEYVQHKGGREVVDLLKADERLAADPTAKKGIDDMELLFTYLDVFDVADRVSFDLSLARGLDYYTGVIYEVVTEGSAPAVLATGVDEAHKPAKKKDNDEDRSNDPTVGIGSIAAGGRYDELVNMFAPKRNIPCVGISFGVDRIFRVMKERLEKEAREKGTSALRPSEVDVYVMAFGGANGLLKERMAAARDLWAGGVKAEFSAKVKPKLPQQFKAAEAGGVPLAVIVGEDELAAGKIRLKALGLPDGHPDKEGKLVPRANLVTEVKTMLQETEKASASMPIR